MCLETTERSKHEKRMTPGLKMRWIPFCDHALDDQGLKPAGAKMGNVSARRHLRQKQRRTRQLRASDPTTPSTKAALTRPSEACGSARPAGAMAPPNTTQYLMDTLYDDLKMDAQSTPDGLYTPFDSCSDSCLYFQQKDFEQLFSTNLN